MMFKELLKKAKENNNTISEFDLSEYPFQEAYEYCKKKGIQIVEDYEEDLDDKIPVEDGIKIYMRQVSQFPLLTLEEEIEAAENGNKELLINSNLRLVISVAKRYKNKGIPFLDLIQEGNLGLMHAVEHFDLSKGYRLSTYATWWIRQYITRALSNQSRSIRIPVHMVEFSSKVKKIYNSLAAALNREPTTEEIAEEGKIPVEKVKEVFEMVREPISLDIPTGEDEDGTLSDIVPDYSSYTPEKVAEENSSKETIDRVLDTLTEREKEIIVLRFGLKDNKPKSMEEVGKMFKLTKERIRQIENKALRKLRNPLRANILRESCM